MPSGHTAARYAWNPLFVIVVAAVLAAAGCGGGGGGGGGNPNVPPPVASPSPTPSQPLAIDAANAFDVALLAVAVPESLIQLTLSLVNRTVDLHNARGPLVLEQACPPGTATIALTDRDGDGALSQGDRVTLRFVEACQDTALNDQVRGVLSAELETTQAARNGDLVLDGVLSVTEPLLLTEPGAGPDDGGVRVSGQFRIAVYAAAGEHPEIVTIESLPGQDLIVSLDDGAGTELRENIRNFAVRRELVQDPGGTRYQLDFHFTDLSGIADGRFECATSSPLSGQLRDWPDAGRVVCRGAGTAEVSVVGRATPLGPSVDVLLDASGSGAPVPVDFPPGTAGNWWDLAEGVMFRLVVAELAPRFDDEEPPAASGTSINIAINDAVYEPVGDRIYVSNAAGIVVIDAQTLGIAVTVPVPGTPGELAVSDDGARLWFARVGESFIQSMTIVDLALDSPIPLGDYGISPRVAHELAAVPGRSDIVLATMDNRQELVAYDLAGALPGSLSINGHLSRLAMRDANSVIATDDQSSGFAAYRIAFDAATGLTLERTLNRLAGDLKARLHLGNRHVFTDTGAIFNEIDETAEGRLPAGGNAGPIRWVAVDRDAARVYAYRDIGPDTLNVYRESPLALTASYRVNPPPGFARRLLATPHSLLIATESGLLRLPVANLADNLPEEPCVREDLSGLITPRRYVLLRCRFNDAVFDAVRNRLYAAVPGIAGPSGNAVAVIDPDHQTVEARIPIGADSSALTLSPDATLLYPVTHQTSMLPVVDVAAQALDSSVRLGFRLINESFEYHPNQPIAVAVSANNPRDVLVGYQEAGVEWYQSGVKSPRGAETNRSYRYLFLRSDDRVAVTTGFEHTGIFTVDSDGVTLETGNANLLPGAFASQRHDHVYSSRGAALELNSLSGTTPCFSDAERGQFDGVAADPDSARVYYARPNGPDIIIQGCDFETGQVTDSHTYPLFGGGFGALKALRFAGAGQLVVVYENAMLFIDAPAL
jgi:DNA-binding beta-propeller fold protein YncE